MKRKRISSSFFLQIRKKNCRKAVLLSLNIEFLFESVNAAACVNKLLFARKERMAFGTDIYTYFFFCGTGMDLVSAYAFYCAVDVFGMNSFFHLSTPSFLIFVLWYYITDFSEMQEFFFTTHIFQFLSASLNADSIFSLIIFDAFACTADFIDIFLKNSTASPS